MGGQFNYFGLWVDQEFGTGHSKAKPKCTTYDSPQLSAKEEFTIAVLEAWAVGPPPKPKVGLIIMLLISSDTGKRWYS